MLFMLKQMSKDTGMSILFISHDIKVVEELCDYLYILKEGRIVDEGKAKALFSNSKNECYNGPQLYFIYED